jgi:hypothetical protein
VTLIEGREADFADLTRPEQLNVLADHGATAALDKLRAARKTTEFYPLLACRGYLRNASGYITSRAHSEPNSASTNFERTFKKQQLVRRGL